MSQKIEHTGVITSISDTTISVQIAQLSACSSCHAKAACSASDVSIKIIEADRHDPSLKIGDNVKITGQNSMGLLAVLLAFVAPFTLILLSLLILTQYSISESISGTISLAVLVPYFIILSLFKGKLKNKLKFTAEKV